MPKKNSLLERTRTLLKKDKRNLRELSDATGLGYFWLRSFRKELQRDFGVRKVEALHNELSK